MSVTHEYEENMQAGDKTWLAVSQLLRSKETVVE